MDIISFYRRSLRGGIYWTLAMGTVLGIILFWRRSVNGFTPQGALLPLTVFVFVILSAVLCLICRPLFRAQPKSYQRIGLLLIPVGLLYMGAFIQTDTIPQFLLTVVIGLLFHGIIWFWSDDSLATDNHTCLTINKNNEIEQHDINKSTDIRKNVPENTNSAIEYEDSEEEIDSQGEYLESEFPENVWQQWTRQKDENGNDVQSGWFRVTLAQGQKIASINAVFCPPFETMPETECALIDGPEMKLEVAVCYLHGARIDLKLYAPSPIEQQVLIQITATEKHDSCKR